MDIPCIIFGVSFIIFGVLVMTGKLHLFVKSWKNMSDEEKKSLKIKSICLNIGGVIVLSGIIFLISGLIEVFRAQFFLISMIVWIVLAGIDVIYILKSKRYR